MNGNLLKDALGWGIAIWLFGHVLFFLMFLLSPFAWPVWPKLPFGLFFAAAVLVGAVRSTQFRHYVILAVAWPLLGILLDYYFLHVSMESPNAFAPNVWVYYALLGALPLAYGKLVSEN